MSLSNMHRWGTICIVHVYVIQVTIIFIYNIIYKHQGDHYIYYGTIYNKQQSQGSCFQSIQSNLLLCISIYMLHYDIILLRIGIIYKILREGENAQLVYLFMCTYICACLIVSSVLLASVGPPPLSLLAGCTGRFLEIFSTRSELMETNPYTFYLGTVSGSSDSTILMQTCNDQTEVRDSRRPVGRFINWLRTTLRR